MNTTVLASSHRLATILAARLQPTLPAGIALWADGSNVKVLANGLDIGGSAAAAIVEDDDDRSFDERCESALWAMLSGIQDSVIEWLGEPWPRLIRNDIALPRVRSDGTRFHFSYGDVEQSAAIVFPPIEISELTRLEG